MTLIEADVAIIGAGPVGLTLALLLAKNDHRVVVVERRDEDVAPELKANHVSARSMELFRRLGLARAIRESGLPPEFPHSVALRSSFAGQELARVHIPCTRDRYSDVSGPDGSWPTPEPAHRGNVIYFGPILQRAAAAAPSITMLYGHEADAIEQSADLVRVFATNGHDGDHVEVRARYAVGCEGGSSLSRHAMGAEFVGDAVVQKWQTSYIECSSLLEEQSAAPAWATIVFNRQRCGTVYAIDGRSRWLVHNYIGVNEDAETVDSSKALRAILGRETLEDVLVLETKNWTGRRLISSKLRQGRIFLCGDSAHIWAPWAGYGMNCGLADAELLAWCLSATLEGWGGPAVLDVYEAERLPVIEALSWMVKQKAQSVAGDRRNVPEGIGSPELRDSPAVSRFVAAAYEHNVEQFCAAGLNFGYVYEDSPCIVYDDTQAPPFSMGHYEPSITPGARFPHFWMDGAADSFYDHLGPGFTALTNDRDDIEGLEAVAGRLRVPLQVVLPPSPPDLPGAKPGEVYLIRSDAHLVWRGKGADAQWEDVLRKVTGRIENGEARVPDTSGLDLTARA